MIMTSFHQNQSPPISEVGERVKGRGCGRRAGESGGGREGGKGGEGLAGWTPCRAERVGGMDSIPGNPLGQGTAWSWQHRVAVVFLKIPH